jgi:hypothetical protein
MNILALLQSIQPELTNTDVRRFSRIAQALLSLVGRVTMLGLSRWAGKGGSYRTVQRFFRTALPWTAIFDQFFAQQLYQPEHEYFLAGDECVVTKSGKATHGLDYFFSGLLSKVVPSIAIFTVSLISVEERQSYPLQVRQVVRSAAEKAAAKGRKKTKPAKTEPPAPKRKPGRPKGSHNQDKTQVRLTEELQRIQTMLKQQVARLAGRIRLRHIALDGYFGHNPALQMVRHCELHLVSKLRRDAALYLRYTGPQKSRGPRKRYGQKIDYRQLPEQYLVERRLEDGCETRIYQAELLHREFAQPLNVVILTKTHLQSGARANVNLFSSDLELGYAELIDRYSLRFQIEFNFRDAKQHWGLEDFMNVKEVPLTNALNLSLFMVNLSQVLLREFRQTHPEGGILDLKAHFRAARYFEETIKWLPQKPEPILLDQIFGRLAGLGCIHDVKVLASSP